MTKDQWMLEQLTNLRDGKTVVLSHITNQRGENIVNLTLRFHDGQWLCWGITCDSSSAHGLGTCQCVSHNADDETPESREMALQMLKDAWETEDEDRAERAEEIRWLNEEIERLRHEIGDQPNDPTANRTKHRGPTQTDETSSRALAMVV